MVPSRDDTRENGRMQAQRGCFSTVPGSVTPPAKRFSVEAPTLRETHHLRQTRPVAVAAQVGGSIAAAVGNDDPRLQQINEILDERIRPALMSDGGWLEVVDLKDDTLSIRYQGACGSCPSAISGTLMAIEGMLKQEVDPEIEVITV